jgi:F0F1-type ATP synthase membrane subunit c/vacuolar-type H+-ATPase subunit K
LNIENIDIERYIDMFDFSGFVALAAGLSVGMGGLAAGYAIGIVGDYVSILFFYE